MLLLARPVGRVRVFSISTIVVSGVYTAAIDYGVVEVQNAEDARYASRGLIYTLPFSCRCSISSGLSSASAHSSLPRRKHSDSWLASMSHPAHSSATHANGKTTAKSKRTSTRSRQMTQTWQTCRISVGSRPKRRTLDTSSCLA